VSAARPCIVTSRAARGGGAAPALLPPVGVQQPSHRSPAPQPGIPSFSHPEVAPHHREPGPAHKPVPPHPSTRAAPREMLVQWSSHNSSRPVVRWGTEEGKLPHTAEAQSHTYT
jgi:hypothetical protein